MTENNTTTTTTIETVKSGIASFIIRQGMKIMDARRKVATDITDPRFIAFYEKMGDQFTAIAEKNGGKTPKQFSMKIVVPAEDGTPKIELLEYEVLDPQSIETILRTMNQLRPPAPRGRRAGSKNQVEGEGGDSDGEGAEGGDGGENTEGAAPAADAETAAAPVPAAPAVAVADAAAPAAAVVTAAAAEVAPAVVAAVTEAVAAATPEVVAAAQAAEVVATTAQAAASTETAAAAAADISDLF